MPLWQLSDLQPRTRASRGSESRSSTPSVMHGLHEEIQPFTGCRVQEGRTEGAGDTLMVSRASPSASRPDGHLLRGTVAAERLHGPRALVKDCRTVRHAHLHSALSAGCYGVTPANCTPRHLLHPWFLLPNERTVGPRRALVRSSERRTVRGWCKCRAVLLVNKQ